MTRCMYVEVRLRCAARGGWYRVVLCVFFFFSSRRRHTRFKCDWSSDVCSSDLYIFAREQLRTLLGPDIQFIDTGAPVARQTRRVLDRLGTLTSESGPLPAAEGQVQLMTTGSLQALQSAASRWLELPAQCCSSVQVGESSAVPAAA